MRPGDALNKHSTLIANGWTYNPTTDLYTAPDGRRCTYAEAWATHTRATAPKVDDPRRSKPI